MDDIYVKSHSTMFIEDQAIKLFAPIRNWRGNINEQMEYWRIINSLGIVPMQAFIHKLNPLGEHL